jgi:P pilus assembly chaperone PapD
MLKGFLAMAITAVMSTVQAAPVISIGEMHKFIESNARTLLKQVSNTGTATAFVRIEVKEIVYENGKPVERDVSAVSLTQGATQPSLIASPARLIIPANSAQTTRWLTMGPRTDERYYRVRFVPVMPEQSDDFALTDEQRTTYADSLSAGLTLLTGYGAIIVARPDPARYDTRMTDEAGRYQVHNAGNSTIALTELHDCNTSGTDCSAQTTRRVLPGSRAVIDKGADRVYRATLVEGRSTKTVTF